MVRRVGNIINIHLLLRKRLERRIFLIYKNSSFIMFLFLGLYLIKPRKSHPKIGRDNLSLEVILFN